MKSTNEPSEAEAAGASAGTGSEAETEGASAGTDCSSGALVFQTESYSALNHSCASSLSSWAFSVLVFFFPNRYIGDNQYIAGVFTVWLSPITSFHHIGDNRYYRDILESVPTRLDPRHQLRLDPRHQCLPRV
jgi:hypothetical protein